MDTYTHRQIDRKIDPVEKSLDILNIVLEGWVRWPTPVIPIVDIGRKILVQSQAGQKQETPYENNLKKEEKLKNSRKM